MRQEAKPYNIHTTVISPGAVDTELPGSVTEPDLAENFKRGARERPRFLAETRVRGHPGYGGVG